MTKPTAKENEIALKAIKKGYHEVMLNMVESKDIFTHTKELFAQALADYRMEIAGFIKTLANHNDDNSASDTKWVVGKVDELVKAIEEYKG